MRQRFPKRRLGKSTVLESKQNDPSGAGGASLTPEGRERSEAEQALLALLRERAAQIDPGGWMSTQELRRGDVVKIDRRHWTVIRPVRLPNGLKGFELEHRRRAERRWLSADGAVKVIKLEGWPISQLRGPQS